MSRLARESALLQSGAEPPGALPRWGNLGLWPEVGHAGPLPGYAEACAALARRVGEAAGMAPGDRVLSIACGAGEELALWVRGFGAARAEGVDAAPAQVERARERLAQLGLGDVASVHREPQPGVHDRVVCVDAAYHVAPRHRLLGRAFERLRPGGTLAFTDLLFDGVGSRRPRPLALAGWWAGVATEELLDAQASVGRIVEAGFRDVRVERLDDAVLGGFARFVSRHAPTLGLRRLDPAWWRPALTARLIPAARAAGLGYALFSATKPSAAKPSACA